MAQTAILKKKYTYEDYLKTHDDKRYQLIDGDLIMTPSPDTEHQRIAGQIYYLMRKHVIEHDFGEVFFAPYDVRLDDENVVQPDILFVSKERAPIIGEDNIHGAPDLVVEILSEGTAYRDTIQKKMLYARSGVKEYWIVAPAARLIELYALKGRVYQLVKILTSDDVIESHALAGFKVELKAIFS